MKNKYKQHLDHFTLKQDVKKEINEAVEHYNDKKQYRRLRTVLATSIVIMLGIGAFYASGVFNVNNKHSFVVKADENVYVIEKSELIIQQSQVKEYSSSWNPVNKTVTIDPMFAPLNITVEGEGIETITYTVEGNASIQKLIKVDKETIEAINEEGIIPDRIPYGSLCNSNAERCWEEAQPSLSEGVTIAYDKQNEDDYLYGISLKITAPELFEYTTNVEQIAQIVEETKKVLKKAFSEVAINVRVNYADGSIETQKLVFNINDLDIPILKQ